MITVLVPSNKIYVGAYKSFNNAKKFQRKLEKMGVVSLINKYIS